MTGSTTMHANMATQLPIIETDVLVAGGGCAGFGAAVASARTGAQTLLVERAGFTGGILTSVGNPWFDGVAHLGTGDLAIEDGERLDRPDGEGGVAAQLAVGEVVGIGDPVLDDVDAAVAVLGEVRVAGTGDARARRSRGRTAGEGGSDAETRGQDEGEAAQERAEAEGHGRNL